MRMILAIVLCSASVAADTYYLAPESGDDANSGLSSASPVRTYAAVTNALGQTMPKNVTIRLRSGETLREEVRLGDGSTLTFYGGGFRPSVNAGDVATNWSKVDGLENVYAISNWVVSADATGSGRTLTCIEDGKILQYRTSLASCESTPGSFFAPKDGAIQLTNTVFIHPTTGGDPNTNGLSYEVAKRRYAVFGGNRVSIIGVDLANQIGNNGSIDLGRDSDVRQCVVRNGHKHSALIASGRIADTDFLLADYSSGGAMVVVFDSVLGGQRAIVERCRFIGSSRFKTTVNALQWHNGVGLPVPAHIVVRDCVLENLSSAGGGSGDRADWINPIVRRCATGFGIYGGINNVIGLRYFPPLPASPQQLVNGSGVFAITAGDGGELFISDAGIVTGWGQTTVKLAGTTNFGVSFHNSTVISQTPGTFSSGFRFIAPSQTNLVTISNSLFSGISRTLFLDAGNMVQSSDKNVFDGQGSQTVNGTSYSWGDYTNTFGNDLNTFTNGANVVQPYEQFGVKANSSAITNQSGVGWFRRMPVNVSPVPYPSRPIIIQCP